MLPSQRQVCPATDDDFVKLLYPLQNCAMDSTTIVLQKKVSKMNLKISHKLRQPDMFVKGFKKSKIDF